MTVYADILLLLNLYIDFFLLWTVRRLLGLRARPRRLLLGALAGALLSLTALLGLEGLPALLLGVATALAVTGAAFAPLPLHRFLQAAGCFWLCTLGLAGLVLFALRFFAPRGVTLLGSVVYLDLSPALLFGCTLGAYGLYALARRLLPAGRSALRCSWLTIVRGEHTVRVYAKADTGNALREPFSGLPVIVCQREALEEVAPPGVLAYPSGEAAGGLRLVPFDSLGGGGLLPAFRPDRVLSQGRPAGDCYIALCPRALSAGQYQALYDPALFGES